MQVMADGTGPLLYRRDMNVSEKWAFANSGGTAEILSLSCFFNRGQRRFLFGGNYYETMACFKIIFVKAKLF